MQVYSLEQQIRLLIKTLQMGMGYEQVPEPIEDTELHEAPSGSFYYCLKAMNGDAVISEAKDINNAPVLSNYTIKNGDEFKFPLMNVTLTSGNVVAYKAVTLDAFMN